MNKARVLSLLGLGLLAVFALFPMGCEDGPDTEGVSDYFSSTTANTTPRVEPSSLIISPSQGSVNAVNAKVTFMVRGGKKPYVWSVSDPNRGRIDYDASSTAVYTCTRVGPNSVVVKDQVGHQATAQVTSSGSTPALQIVPPSTGVSGGAGFTINFTAVGGVPPYGQWISAFPALGTFPNPNDGVYLIGLGTGSNIVSITDSAGGSAQASIVQN